MSTAPNPASASTPGTSSFPNTADRVWLALACELAALCPPSTSAFSVGAVIVASDGTELARGYSRESDPLDHAEEAALAKLPAGDPRLATATIYSSLEPCAKRASRTRSCSQLIRDVQIPRVVTAWREPDTFVPGADGTELLEHAGVIVVEIPESADAAQLPNSHLVGGDR